MVDYRKDPAPEIVHDFLRYCKSHNFAESTIREYFMDLRTFFRFLLLDRGGVSSDVPFEQINTSELSMAFVRAITKTDIINYVDFLANDYEVRSGSADHPKISFGLSNNTIHRRMASVKSLFSYLCEQTGQLEKNPTLGVRSLQPETKLPKYLTQSESEQLLDSVNGLNCIRDYCIILLFLSCGLRVSEISRLDLYDIRREKDGSAFLNIRAAKGHKDRQAYLSAECLAALDTYLAERDGDHAKEEDKQALFLSRKHSRVSVRAIQRLVENATKKANLEPYSPHKLRHTAATVMLANGVDLRALQEFLGHNSIKTTTVYTHISSQQLIASTEANPLSHHKKDSF